LAAGSKQRATALDFLSDIREFREFQLKMSEEKIKELIDKNHLLVRSDEKDGQRNYHVFRKDGENVIVMFNGGKCSGIQRMRRDLESVPVVVDVKAAAVKSAPRLQFRLVADVNDTAPADRLDDPTGKEPLRVRREALLDETAIASASVTNAPAGGGVQIEVTFTDAGANRFAEMTGANIGRRLAIIFDGKVLNAPTIHSAITGGHAVITGNFTAIEAEAITAALNARPTKPATGETPLR